MYGIDYMVNKINVGVLASGTGTDLQSIIDASEKGIIDAKVVIVISDNKNAFALKRAEKHNIDNYFINPKNIKKEKHEDKIDKLFEISKTDLIVGAGYMRILSNFFVKKWYGRLINIHPALLPSFKGANGQGDAINYGVKISGCTTHFMDKEMDHGPIILQAAVKVNKYDTRDKLAERILKIEHIILPRTIQLFAENRLKIDGRKVMILPGESWINRYKNYPDVLYSEGF
jgi:phosphoribosylglycinamide formyltransferase-1